MSLEQSLNAMKDDVGTVVVEESVKTQAINTIEEQKNKMMAAYRELVRRGRESDAYKFLCKCLENLKAMLHKLVGHIKDLWNKLVAKIKDMTSNGTPVVA